MTKDYIPVAEELVKDVQKCTLCSDKLPYAPKPIIQIAAAARILIIGLAPGARAHESGTPWDDASGDQLRIWLGVDKNTFYDSNVFGVLPMGFCYPGRGASGDLPPLADCALTWHDRLLHSMPNIKLTLLVGRHAQQQYLKPKFPTLTEAVKCREQLLPRYFPLPHPSPRNRPWQSKNPWFEQDVLSQLRDLIQNAQC